MLFAKELIKSSIKQLNGFLPVYKPAGMCSHRMIEGLRMDMNYVMQQCDINLGDFYMNHARDLEPFAEGLVTFILGYAKQTRRNFALANYVYKAKIEFGVERQYHCIDGKVLSRSSVRHIKSDLIKQTLSKFTGIIDQDRCPSYRLMPQDKKGNINEQQQDNLLQSRINLFNQMTIAKPPVYKPKSPQKYPYTPAPRTLLVESIELDNYSQPFGQFTISCHGEFKIRLFAADLARLLGTKASVVELSRIKEGPITKDDLRVFQAHELNLEYYLPRIGALKSLYREFNDEIKPLWNDRTT